MTNVPKIKPVSSNLDAIVLEWHGRAPRYMLEYKLIREEWEDCRREYTGAGSPSIVVVKGLRHSSAYVFRLSGLNQNGTFDGPGRECTFHTRGAIEQDAPGCCTVS